MTRPAALSVSASLALLVLAPVAANAAPVEGQPKDQTETTAAREVSGPVKGSTRFDLPAAASHVALHWRGNDQAQIQVAFARHERQFGRKLPVVHDDVAETRDTRETYGSVMPADGARSVRVWSDRPLKRLTVLAMSDRGPARISTSESRSREGDVSTSAVPQPNVISRAGWGADESLRFDGAGNEVWKPAFYPTQKLIVHHTAGVNDDPDPAATVRSIYYYHAVTQGFGDIGYNFLVDESGRVYEGRYSREYASGESPTGEDQNGHGVTAAHAQGFNSGTAGIALLGTLTNRDATPAARDSLEQWLAWKAERAGIDPQGSALYTNPVNGTQSTFPNIAGHRDVGATECPGGALYASLPSIRSDVAARIAGSGGEPPPTTTRHYRPDGYTISSGSVYAGRGAVSRLFEDDGTHLDIATARSGGSHVADVRPYVRIGDAERNGLDRLAVKHDGNTTTAGAAVTLRIHNFRTGAWKTIDGPRTGVTSDRSFQWSNSSSPTDYVAADGEVRFSIRASRSKSFRTRTDLVRFTVEH